MLGEEPINMGLWWYFLEKALISVIWGSWADRAAEGASCLLWI